MEDALDTVHSVSWSVVDVCLVGDVPGFDADEMVGLDDVGHAVGYLNSVMNHSFGLFLFVFPLLESVIVL